MSTQLTGQFVNILETKSIFSVFFSRLTRKQAVFMFVQNAK